MRAPAVALATSAALLAACSDAPTRPDAAARPAQAASAQGRTDRHIIVLKQGKEGVSAATSFQTAMQALGGRVERLHGEIGVLSVRGLSDAAAARLAASSSQASPASRSSSGQSSGRSTSPHAGVRSQWRRLGMKG